MTVLRLRGRTVARVDGAVVELAELDGAGARPVDRFTLDTPVGWIELAPDGESALVRDGDGGRAWWWRRGVGLAPLAAARDSRDRFGCGYVTVDGVSLVLVAQADRLRALDRSGEVRFEADLGRPRRFQPSSFVELPGGRLALHGHEPDDPFEVIVTVAVDRLARDPAAVHVALTTLAPVWDRSIELAIGPGPGTTAVVFRNPDGEEEPDDEDDDRPGGDVAAFTGFYLRDLATGALIERVPFAATVRGGTILHASARAILAFADRTLVSIDRATGTATAIGGTAPTFDRASGQIARLDAAGRIELLAP